jgi:hypothetical protein
MLLPMPKAMFQVVPLVFQLYCCARSLSSSAPSRTPLHALHPYLLVRYPDVPINKFPVFPFLI